MNNFNVFLHTPAHTYIVVYLNHRIKLLNFLAEAKNSDLRIAIVIVFVLKFFLSFEIHGEPCMKGGIQQQTLLNIINKPSI